MTDNEVSVTASGSNPREFSLVTSGVGGRRKTLIIGGQEIPATRAVLTIEAAGTPRLEVEQTGLSGKAEGRAIVTVLSRLIAQSVGNPDGLPVNVGDVAGWTETLIAAGHIYGSETIMGTAPIRVDGELRRARVLAVISPDELLRAYAPEEVIEAVLLQDESLDFLDSGADPQREGAIRIIGEQIIEHAIGTSGDVFAGVTEIGGQKFAHLIVPLAPGAAAPMPPHVPGVQVETRIEGDFPEILPVSGSLGMTDSEILGAVEENLAGETITVEDFGTGGEPVEYALTSELGMMILPPELAPVGEAFAEITGKHGGELHAHVEADREKAFAVNYPDALPLPDEARERLSASLPFGLRAEVTLTDPVTGAVTNHEIVRSSAPDPDAPSQAPDNAAAAPEELE